MAIAAILVGFTVYAFGLGLHAVARDMVGDALWAVMIFSLLGVGLPRARWRTRGGVALAICGAVEVSQLCHQPTLEALRATRLGHLVLGSGFDPRDLLSYALGVAAAGGLDRVMGPRGSDSANES
jgi:hypothetical protein